MSKKIFILTGRSLFTAGVISKLRNIPEMGVFEVFDLRQPNSYQAIAEARPDFVILDETDPEISEQLRGELFALCANLKVIILDPQKDQFRVLQSEEYDGSQIWDLLKGMEDSEDLSEKTIPPARLNTDAANHLAAI